MAIKVPSWGDLLNLVKQVSDRTFQIVTAAVTTLLTILGIAAGVHNLSTAIVSAIFCITIGFLTYVFLYHSAVVGRLILDNANTVEVIQNLSREVETEKSKFSSFRQDVYNADKAFRDLLVKRTILDNNVFRMVVSHDPEKMASIDRLIEEYLVRICDITAEIYASRKHIEREMFSLNIKTIRKHRGKYYYKAVGRSSNLSDGRDDNDENEYELDSNALHDEIMNESSVRCVIVKDITAYVKNYKLSPGNKFTAPIAESKDWYKSSLTSAIYIKPRNQKLLIDGPYTDGAFRSKKGDLIYGFISIDSKTVQFTQYDMDIILEMASHALSVLRLADFIDKISNNIT